jgi:hypothetical protein
MLVALGAFAGVILPNRARLVEADKDVFSHIPNFSDFYTQWCDDG